MIRIDEIYNNTFWPWLKNNRSGIRMFMCDPFGRSDPDSIKNFGNEDLIEYNYIFFFDQEPIHLNVHIPTFDKIRYVSNDDLHYHAVLKDPGALLGYIVTSECDSENVEHVCNRYGWKALYYFFHGWAALDWYRGYDKTYLIPPIANRQVTRTFIAPNRIVAGQRQHRLLMLYHIFKNGMTNNWISCPDTCPVENIRVVDAVKARSLISKYPDIVEVFEQQNLPIDFPNETGHPMHSCWLSLFDEAADSLLYLVTETVATGRRQHLTEKTFKPIALGMPFVIVGTHGCLRYLRRYGFKTFGEFWDESYDDEVDDYVRIERIAQVLKDLDQLTVEEKNQLYQQARSVIEHNWNHFYNGGFEQILWEELQEMLLQLP